MDTFIFILQCIPYFSCWFYNKKESKILKMSKNWKCEAGFEQQGWAGNTRCFLRSGFPGGMTLHGTWPLRYFESWCLGFSYVYKDFIKYSIILPFVLPPRNIIMYTLGGEYPESPAESEESITDESPDNDGSHSQGASPFGTGRASARGFTSSRETTAEKQRKWAVRTFTCTYTLYLTTFLQLN